MTLISTQHNRLGGMPGKYLREELDPILYEKMKAKGFPMIPYVNAYGSKRPHRVEDLIGQEHLSSPNSFLFRAIRAGNIPSLILWGPPGVGKTTIANIIANEIKAPFYTLSAISSGVKEIREVIDKAAPSGERKRSRTCARGDRRRHSAASWSARGGDG